MGGLEKISLKKRFTNRIGFTYQGLTVKQEL